MRRYRHADHAGNHGDVLKHLVLDRLLRRLAADPRPFFYIESHAGRGWYPFTGAPAGGGRAIGVLTARRDAPAPVAGYLRAVRRAGRVRTDCPGAGGGQRGYPGSPAFARQLARAGDRLLLCEQDAGEHEALRQFVAGDPRIKTLRADGFEAAPAALPPAEGRSLLLIDPPYEEASEEERAAGAAARAWQRFPAGIVALWYPIGGRTCVGRLECRLLAAGMPAPVIFELRIRPGGGPGMTGSAMAVTNPPASLEADMGAALPWLASALGTGAGGGWRIRGGGRPVNDLPGGGSDPDERR